MVSPEHTHTNNTKQTEQVVLELLLACNSLIFRITLLVIYFFQMNFRNILSRLGFCLWLLNWEEFNFITLSLFSQKLNALPPPHQHTHTSVQAHTHTSFTVKSYFYQLKEYSSFLPAQGVFCKVISTYFIVIFILIFLIFVIFSLFFGMRGAYVYGSKIGKIKKKIMYM